MSTRTAALIPLEIGHLDLERQIVVPHHGTPQKLTTREVALLRYLAAHPDQAIPREVLQVEVWGYAPDLLTRAVDNTVRRLRLKIERDPANPDHVLTEHGEGYRFVPRRSPALPRDKPTHALYGRSELLAALQGGLAEGTVVTLWGTGGIGKTRLAREVLRQRAGFFVDLSDTHDGAEAEVALVRALAPGEGTVGAALGVLAHALPATVVVLDNCEQNIVGVGALVARLRERAPRLALLATSRRPLGVAGERALAVPILPVAEGVALLQDRVRARAAPIPDALLLAPLVEQLDGLPLALELAAARLGVLGPRDLLERLRRSLDPLAHHGSTGRHSTLSATVAWSWSLLPPWAQRALRGCTAFVGPFDAEAAEQVLPALGPEAPPVLDVLEHLRQESLLQTEADPQGRLRLRLLEAIRLFAAERLVEAGEPDEVRARHAAWCAALPPDRLRDAHAEIWAAWRWAEAHARLNSEDSRVTAALVVSLAEGLEEGLRAHGPALRWRMVVERTATLPGLAAAATEDRVRAALLRLEAHHALGQEVSLADLDALIAVATGTLRVRVLRARARVLRRAGASEAAAAGYRQALAAVSPADDLWRARLRFELATLDADHQRSEAALHGYQAALEGFTRLELPGQAMRTELHMAMLLSEEGALDTARERTWRALRWHQEVGDTRGEGVVRCHLGLIELEAEDLATAAQHLALAQRCCRAVGDRRYEGYAALLSATLAQERGDDLAAMVTASQEALQAFAEVGDRHFWALARARLGVGHALLGHVAQATEDLTQARQALSRTPAPGIQQGLSLLEGFLELARGEITAAQARLTATPDLLPTSFARMAARQLRRALAHPAGQSPSSPGKTR